MSNDDDPKKLERRSAQIAERLKAAIEKTLSRELGPGDRVTLKSNFVKHDAPINLNIDFENPK